MCVTAPFLGRLCGGPLMVCVYKGPFSLETVSAALARPPPPHESPGKMFAQWTLVKLSFLFCRAFDPKL